MDYAAIPTEYAGVRFRSRLEAKWACVFDQLGWEWQYESLDLHGWIPDFRITNARGKKPFLVEVKPHAVLDPAVVNKIIRACPSAAIGEDENGSAADAETTLLILAEHPFYTESERRTAIGWINDVCGNGGHHYFSHAFLTPGEWPNGPNGVWAGETGIWFDRFFDHHEKGRGFLREDHIAGIWAHATNTVQWRAPK